MPVETREISDIAYEIKRLWKNVHPTARPYLEAMYGIRRITDDYGADTAREIVTRFLANASQFSGEDARRLKAELNRLLA